MDRKIGLGIFLMLIIVVIGGCAQQAPPQDQGPNGTSTPTEDPIEMPPMQEEFDNKYVYTTNTSMDQEQFRTHCERVGGTFNECGDICALDADMCAQVCAYTCVVG